MRYVLFVCTHNAGRSQMAQAFGDHRTEEEIRVAADAALAEFQDAPVRSYVMSIANRKAREVLRSGG